MTPTQQLLELRLGGDLQGYVAECRSNGKSWRRIATDLRERTRIKVSHETLRDWYANALTVDAA